MATVLDSAFDVDKLSFEIFSILENKFLFGGYDHHNPKLSLSQHNHQLSTKPLSSDRKIRILSIDGGSATDGILAAKSLSHLECFLRRKSGNASASISDYFDVVAGSGAGGILAALLFTRGNDGRPMFTAQEALRFLIENRRKLNRSLFSRGIFRRLFRQGMAEKLLRSIFGECTLKDTIKSVLIPCYDLWTRAPFVFSRADALEVDGYDFKMSDVCLATSADPMVNGAVEMCSVDNKTKILAVDGGIAMNNPTAAAITHVLNNKQEFPLCGGVEDLLVLSLGGGESDIGIKNSNSSPVRFMCIAGEGASETVDQAVSMAFGQCRTSNYVRVQANGIMARNQGHDMEKLKKSQERTNVIATTEEILKQKNVESVMFKGKTIGESTNLDKLELIGEELMKEQERRKTSILPVVVLKQPTSPSARTSSATTLSTLSSY